MFYVARRGRSSDRPAAGSRGRGSFAPASCAACARPERYRSGRNGGASKASCRVTGTWVRIPPSPPTLAGPFRAHGCQPDEVRSSALTTLVLTNADLSIDAVAFISTTRHSRTNPELRSQVARDRLSPPDIAPTLWHARTRLGSYENDRSDQSGFSDFIRSISSGVIRGTWRMKRTSCHASFSPAGSGLPVPNAGIPVKRMPFSMM